MSALLDTDVLIVGAGPSGMVSALCLAQMGVRSLIVERAEGLNPHPKAHEVNARTLEILMGLGFDRNVLEAHASPPAEAARVVFCKTLQDEFGCIDLSHEAIASKYQRHLGSEQPYLNLSQTELERTLLDRVRQTPETEVHYLHQWEGAQEQADQVVSTVRRLSDGSEVHIVSRYIIGADGASSRVRRSLGIAMEGPDKLQDFVSACFSLNLREQVKTPAKLYWILHPEVGGVLVAHHVDNQWVFHAPVFTPYERREDYTPEVFAKRLGQGLGIDPDAINITSIASWRMTAQVATAFGKGRLFLVGDSAHRFPPTGGLGMNTGIADAHNLCWKLAAVLQGQAHPSLLDTYEQERRPVAQRNCAQSRTNFDKIHDVIAAFGLPRGGMEPVLRILHMRPLRWLPKVVHRIILAFLKRCALMVLNRFGRSDAVRTRVLATIAEQLPHFDRIGLDVGYVYTYGALVHDDAPTPLKPRSDVTDYIPSTAPGARFPHVWLDAAQSRGVHDALGSTGFTLLTGNEGEHDWQEATTTLHAPVRVCSIDRLGETDEARHALDAICSVGPRGALLVRPDGHVAWRRATLPEHPTQSLKEALRACHVR